MEAIEGFGSVNTGDEVFIKFSGDELYGGTQDG